MLQRISFVILVLVLAAGCSKVTKKQHWNEDTVPVKVEFRLVKDDAGEAVTLDDLEEKILIDNRHIGELDVYTNELGGPYISLSMTKEGTKAMLIMTTENIGRRIAIVANGKLLSAPVIQAPISTHGQITGSDLSHKEMRAIADGILKYNALNPGK